jgi:apolipoprotein N-acyltransferase
VRLEFLAWVWMVPLLVALRPVESLAGVLWRVYLTLLVSFAFIMSWVAVASPAGFVIAALISAAVFTVPFVGLHFARRAFGWRAALLSLPFVWTAWEWLFHRTELSFGAVEMGQSQANLYWLIQYVDMTGVWGIAFWLALFNVLVVLAFEGWRAETPRRDKRPRFKSLARRLAAVAALMLLPPLAYSAYVFLGESRHTQTEREISVLLVQTNINPWERLDNRSAAFKVGRAAALTRKALAQERPDLVVWPEGTVSQLWSFDKEARDNVRREVARWQTPLLTGVMDARRVADESHESATYEYFNGAVLLAPPDEARETAGAPARADDVRESEPYYRRVLMPFVERVPYREHFPFSRIPAIQIADDTPELTAGDRATTFDFRDRSGQRVTTATVICYEQLYPAETAELVRGGAQVLAFLTNQGWFSKTHGPYELAALSRIRSIETRRAAVRAANTGVTWVVDAYGRVQAEVPWWSEQTLPVRVRLSDEQTIYVRYTDYFPKLCLCASLALFFAATLQKVRRWFRPPKPVSVEV